MIRSYDFLLTFSMLEMPYCVQETDRTFRFKKNTYADIASYFFTEYVQSIAKAMIKVGVRAAKIKYKSGHFTIYLDQPKCFHLRLGR